MRYRLVPAVVALAAIAIVIASGARHSSAEDEPGGASAALQLLAERAPVQPPGVTGQAVIGDDTRIRITDTTAYPWSAIAYLEIYDGADEFSCTGTFIGPRVLLTAAHCLWSSETGWVDDVAVVPGKDGDSEPFGFEWATNIWVPDGWIDSGGVREWDWGLVVIGDDDITAETGWLWVAVRSDATLRRSDFKPAIFGYPADVVPERTLWGSIRDEFLDVSDYILQHDVDTAPGESGSAVFSANTATALLGGIVGVHSGSSGAGSTVWNEATRIDEFFLDDLLAGCDSLDCEFEYEIDDDVNPAPSPSPSPSPSPTVPPGSLPFRVVVPLLGRN